MIGGQLTAIEESSMSATDDVIVSDVPDVPVLTLVEPMPGFDDLTRFALVRFDDDGLLGELRSLEDPATSFLVVPPAVFFPDHVVEVPDEVARLLDVRDAGEVLVLLVVTVGPDLAGSTANLAAPVLVNVRTQQACQVVLDDGRQPLAAPLVG